MCKLNVHKFSQNVHNSIQTFLKEYTKLCTFFKIVYIHFLHSTCTFFKECTQFYTFNIHNF